MRVISGKRRGLKLLSPEGLSTRPTTDRVKESLFNIIQMHIPSSNVLDLFGGSGSLGIEAISRGCRECTFVDIDKNAIDIIDLNIKKASFEENAKVIKSDVFSFLDLCKEKFDLIFLDPPYNKNFVNPVFEKIYEKDLLIEDGIIVFESEVGGEKVENENFICIKSAKYGKTVISIFKHK